MHDVHRRETHCPLEAREARLKSKLVRLLWTNEARALTKMNKGAQNPILPHIRDPHDVASVQRLARTRNNFYA